MGGVPLNRRSRRKRYQFEATASDDELEDELDNNLDEIFDNRTFKNTEKLKRI